MVEDEIFIAMDLQATLEDAGYSVLGPVPSIDEALDLLKNSRPDVAVLNYSLRGETIVPVAERLHELSVPMLLASGDFPKDAPLADVCEALANAQSLGKPLDSHTLLAALDRLKAA
ncbi:hypothetical protein [Palleronia marisminoris]|uniref:hypothetical protein n=1 Tax=Palleronia marisminoris TaxID=315423 RepID=UPI001587B54A|nr:hypothetical protein [Palleronia marisminoris]